MTSMYDLNLNKSGKVREKPKRGVKHRVVLNAFRLIL